MSGPILLALRIVLAISLYAFLGWALYTLWHEIRLQSRQVTPSPPPTLLLSSHKEDSLHHQRFNIPEIIIGREPSCDFILDDSTVSAKHARFLFRQNQWWIEDMHSTNGTLLNGQPVEISMVVTSGDRIACGQEQLMIEIEEAQE
jgi:hypothetical protein